MSKNSQSQGLWKKIGTKQPLIPHLDQKQSQLKQICYQKKRYFPLDEGSISFTDLQISCIEGTTGPKQCSETEDSFCLPYQFSSQKWVCSRCQESVTTKKLREQGSVLKIKKEMLQNWNYIKFVISFLKEEHRRLQLQVDKQLKKRVEIFKDVKMWSQIVNHKIEELQKEKQQLLKHQQNQRIKMEEMTLLISQLSINLSKSEEQNKNLQGLLNKKLSEDIQQTQQRLLRNKNNLPDKKVSSLPVPEMRLNRLQTIPSEKLYRYRSIQNMKIYSYQTESQENEFLGRSGRENNQSSNNLICCVEGRLKNLKKQIQKQIQQLKQH